MSDFAIEARDLSKTFPGGVVAVNGLDLAVPARAVYGLIGRNGAGKTTTIRMLMGLLRPNRGVARVLGADLWTAPREVRARVGYVSQRPWCSGHAARRVERRCGHCCYRSSAHESILEGFAIDRRSGFAHGPRDRQVIR